MHSMIDSKGLRQGLKCPLILWTKVILWLKGLMSTGTYDISSGFPMATSSKGNLCEGITKIIGVLRIRLAMTEPKSRLVPETMLTSKLGRSLINFLMLGFMLSDSTFWQ